MTLSDVGRRFGLRQAADFFVRGLPLVDPVPREDEPDRASTLRCTDRDLDTIDRWAREILLVDTVLAKFRD